METCFQLYKKSTFPPLLDNYLPLNCRNQKSPNQQRIETDNEERTRKSNCDLSDELKDERIKQDLQEQRHLETYKNLHKLRNILCERYRTLLNEKVQKQRFLIKMSDLRFQQHFKPKAKKCISSHKVPLCKLSHDTKYLESIPQSSSYMIIGLQNELTKLGIIKNQQDYENFWRFVQEGVYGSKLKQNLPDIKAKMVATKPFPVCTSARTKLPQPANGFRNIRRLKKSIPSDAGQCLTHLMSRQMKTHQETEQMSPQFSASESFSPSSHADLSYSGWSWSTIGSCDWQHLASDVELGQLTSLSEHRGRLLEQNGQFSDVRKEQTVHDLKEYLFPNWHECSGGNHNQKIIEENTVPSSVSAKLQKKHHKDVSKVFRVPKEKKKMLQEKDVETAEDQKCSMTTFVQHEIIAVPLTLEDVALHHPVVEAKPLGPLWTNYADKESTNNSEKY